MNLKDIQKRINEIIDNKTQKENSFNIKELAIL